jgi:hypothetical protein
MEGVTGSIPVAPTTLFQNIYLIQQSSSVLYDARAEASGPACGTVLFNLSLRKSVRATVREPAAWENFPVSL